MTLPCPGPTTISLSDIQNEFGGSNPISLSEYYRGGSYTTSNNTNVPTSGAISLGNFFCGVAEIVAYVTSTTTNLNVSTLFTSSDWSSTVPKRVVVNSGVTVGATNTSNYALNVPSGFGGTFKLDNNGSILGAGGAANSGTGGNAIYAGGAMTINNAGTIYGGGGGGGKGGTGGNGYYQTTSSYDCSYWSCGGGSGFHSCGSFDGACRCQNNNGSCYCQRPNYGFQGPQWACCSCCCYNSRTCSNTNTYYTSGGAGGNGGRGQGYNHAAANGSAGSGGGTNAGTGGTGGNGASYGNTGATGGSGSNGNNGSGSAGSAGGAAGYYIVNNSNVTWTATGTRAGRVG